MEPVYYQGNAKWRKQIAHQRVVDGFHVSPLSWVNKNVVMEETGEHGEKHLNQGDNQQ